MNRPLWWVLFSVLIVQPLYAQVPDTKPTDDWWTRAPMYRTKYYSFKTDLPENDAHALATHMDAVFESYMALFAKMPVRLQRLPRLYMCVFAEQADFLKVSRERFNHDATGSWGTCHSRGNEIFLMAYRGRYSLEDMKSVLQHEGFHQVGHTLFSGMPTWVHEGLAELFERGVMVGSTLAIGEYAARDRARVLKALETKSFMPVEQLLAIASADWNERVRARESSELYLHVWSLVQFFLFAENGKYEQGFLSFLLQLNRQVEWKAAFVNAFGNPDFRVIERKWEEYLQTAPTTDYRETVRRLDFLAAGAIQLHGQGIHPTSFEDMKAKLQELRFERAAELFGKSVRFNAGADAVFEVPGPDGSIRPRFTLTDPRGTPAAADRPAPRVAKPLCIATAGLTPEMFIARPTQRGKQLEYTLVAEPSRAVESRKGVRKKT